MTDQHVIAMFRRLGDAVSRREALGGIAGLLARPTPARMREATGAKHPKPQTCSRHEETPSESCYRLCVTDPKFPMTQERERQCWTACDVWGGDYEPA
jgi:hypothetical protein